MKKFIYSLTFTLIIILVTSFNCYSQYDQSGGAWGSTKNYLSVIQNNTIPSADDTYDLGSSTKKWKDLYVDGNAYIDQIGINTSTPRRFLDVLDPNNAQIRGTHTDDTNYFEIQADPNGDAIFTASGGEISFSDENLSTTGTLGAGISTLSKIVSPELEYSGDITLDTIDSNTSHFNISNSGAGDAQLDLNGSQITSNALSDVASIGMLDESESVSGAWIFTDQTSAATIGDGAQGIDFRILFDGNATDGSITYMEDEDRIDFDNDVDVVMDLTAGTVSSDGAITSSGNLTIDKHRPFIYLDPNSGDTQWNLGVLSDSNGVSDDSFRIGTGTDPNSNAKFIITSSGNVGIGTSSPEYKLDVTIGARTGFRLSNTGGASNNTDLVMIAGSTGSTGEASVIFGDADDISMGWVTYDNSNNSLRFGTSNTQDRVVIDSSGNFGIGTTSPDALLHAEKSTAGTNSLQEVSRESVTTTNIPTTGFGIKHNLEVETDPNSAGNMENLAFYGAAVEDNTTGSEYGAFVVGTMSAGATATEKMRINSSGGMVLQGAFNYGIDTEATDAYVIDLDPNLSAYTDGLIIYWDANNPNDGACSLRLTGGLAAKAIKTQGHDDPPANYIEEDSRPGVMFNAGADYWMLITPDANP